MMVKFTQSMAAFLEKFHADLIVPLRFGHLELYTPELRKEYADWIKTDEGRQYLKGGSKYREDEE